MPVNFANSFSRDEFKSSILPPGKPHFRRQPLDQDRFKICTGILPLVGILHINASKQVVQEKAEKLIELMCEKLNTDGLNIEENKSWTKNCHKWIKSMDYQQRADINDEHAIDESSMKRYRRPRKISFKSAFRVSSARVSAASSRSSSSSRFGSIGTSGSRISSFGSNYHSARTGASIYRPDGWLWSRTRYVFLPVSQNYVYRSRSSYNQNTTLPIASSRYYYCTPSNSSTSNTSKEIKCSSINGDSQCCEDSTTEQAYCCGGSIDGDVQKDFNKATKTIARIFFTLSVITFFMHIFMRQLHR
ncbi:unnamed protein product [Rotaria socialis]|uniref:Uncharacterized protein n=1 Tax=Rotaria socialis TaxID=392032 RepID=A0A818ND64_9BILA|nr:unnamed protein product [Rotaria socialis]CAF4432421.1 unnamed protein product [Rotaria socialis]CAF4480552.1 unnamed protein product [Rotaria socialis]CAF4687379.1 unnamed protein product [Rotaria socialis]